MLRSWLIRRPRRPPTTAWSSGWHRWGTNEGLAAARARGRVGGRPTVVNEQLLRAARDMLPNPDDNIETIAKLLGVSVGTLYNHVPDLRELSVPRIPVQLDRGAG
ncbi:hypothetical protein ACFV8T_26355 [Streptomyces sp. NPDC059832]|uniref:hypothetical protein n=1 Tax=Streptomyces sp. NPDC059832 TaxID=3346966 RepID=UPI003667A059